MKTIKAWIVHNGTSYHIVRAHRNDAGYDEALDIPEDVFHLWVKANRLTRLANERLGSILTTPRPPCEAVKDIDT